MANDVSPFKLDDAEKRMLNQLLDQETSRKETDEEKPWSEEYSELFKARYLTYRQASRNSRYHHEKIEQKEAALKALILFLRKLHNQDKNYFDSPVNKALDLDKTLITLDATVNIENKITEQAQRESQAALQQLTHAHTPLSIYKNTDKDVEKSYQNLMEHVEEISAEYYAQNERQEFWQDVGDTTDAAASMVTTGLQSARHALPKDLSTGVHAATVATSLINFILIPALYIVAKAQGKPVPVTASNNAVWAASAVFLALAIVGVAVPPLGLTMLAISGAVSVVVGIGSLLNPFRERAKLEKKIDAEKEKLTSLIKEQISVQTEVEKKRKELSACLGKDQLDTKLLLIKNKITELDNRYDQLTNTILSKAQNLKSLKSNADYLTSKSDFLPRWASLGLAALGLVATILLFNPFTAPIGIAMFIGVGAASVGLMGYYMGTYLHAHRENKAYAEERKVIKEEKAEEQALRTTSTISLYKKMFMHENQTYNLSAHTHQGRVREIALRLETILDDKNIKKNEELIAFFKNFTLVHMNDKPAKGQPKPIFDELPKTLTKKAFAHLQNLINDGQVDRDSLNTLREFDHKFTEFFSNYGVRVKAELNVSNANPQVEHFFDNKPKNPHQ